MEQEGIQDFRTTGFGTLFAATVADMALVWIRMAQVLVVQLEVVPVFATHKQTAVFVAQLQVVQTFENFRETVAFFEVQPAIVTRLGIAGTAVGVTNKFFVSGRSGPAGTN